MPLPRVARALPAVTTLAASLLLFGCNSKPSPAPTAAATQPATQHAQYPPRPAVPPPAFKVFHHDASSFTLVTKDDATDEQIESLIWRLRDAAHTHTFDTINIPQKLIDDRKPIVWFHLYRGTKCASEKYASGPPPCGGSYHAAGDYTYGGYANREADSGVLLHGEDHEIQLWNSDTPYAAPTSGASTVPGNTGG
jgi:hypothetical protein